MSKKLVRLIFTFLCFFWFGTVLMAHSSAQTEHRSVGKELDVWVSKTEQHLVPAADAMPEDKYDFAPTVGKFEGVRTFAEEVKHLASTNYILASTVLGEKPPRGEQNEKAPDSLKSKAEIMEYLKGSFTYLHRAVASIKDNNQTRTIGADRSTSWLAETYGSEAPSAFKDRTRPGLIVDALCHSWNHYGQIVEYLRMNGIVPPASR